MKKCREAQHMLYNNEALADFHFILSQEPYRFLLNGEVVLAGLNPKWIRFVLMGRRQQYPPVRSYIWVFSELTAIQLQVDLVDIIVVVSHVSQRRLVIVLVYILNKYLRRTKEKNLEELFSRLEIINNLIQGKLLRDLYTKVVIIDNFNWHNLLQRGNYISIILMQEKSAPIINFMADYSL